MKARNSNEDMDAGSRMHVLDWLESPDFLQGLRSVVSHAPVIIPNAREWQPKGRGDHRESVLTGPEDPFLTRSQSDELRKWWLVYSKGSKLPTWDLAVVAKSADSKALVLVEAKAHETEFSTAAKTLTKRDTPEEQARTDANHARIGYAIAEASDALSAQHAGVHICLHRCYQFANRIAFSWKLASMGIPVVLIYLGFIGDSTIAPKGDFFACEEDWKRAFTAHTCNQFPSSLLERDIPCGKASFRAQVRSLRVKRLSPPIAERRLLT